MINENEKIQKVLASLGYGSRRQIEAWITEGRISVNGKPAHIGMRISTADKITIDKKPVRFPKKTPSHNVVMYHKPEGEVCTRSDPEGRPTIFDHLPKLSGRRWISIGRLDLNTSGLILLTTDGELAHHLMHPSYEIEREYAVRILGEVTPQMLTALKKGVKLEDGIAHFDEIIDAGGSGANHWYKVILKEGRNREVRRLWETQGVKVSRLIRTRFGSVPLPRLLRPGKFRELTAEEVFELSRLVRDQAGLF